MGKYSLNVCIVSSIQLWVIKLPPPPRWQNLITFKIRIILWINSTQGYGKLLNRICCAIENRIFRFEMKILKKKERRKREKTIVFLYTLLLSCVTLYILEKVHSDIKGKVWRKTRVHGVSILLNKLRTVSPFFPSASFKI